MKVMSLFRSVMALVGTLFAIMSLRIYVYGSIEAVSVVEKKEALVLVNAAWFVEGLCYVGSAEALQLSMIGGCGIMMPC
jgi:hypothetical protein